MNLEKLSIIGFTHGDSICAHCGTGIKNLVLVRDLDGVTHHIGTDCALRVGLDARQVKDRITDERKAELDRKAAERAAKDAERVGAYRAKISARAAEVAHISAQLRAIGGEFLLSLADQLERGTLSSRQAFSAVDAILGRRNKSNADAHDMMMDTCQFSDVI